jgi:2-oxoglutarate dehydrogenase E1 component
MAALIRKEAPVLAVYADSASSGGRDPRGRYRQAIQSRLDEALGEGPAGREREAQRSDHRSRQRPLAGMTQKFSRIEPTKTAVSIDAIREVCAAFGRVPEGFNSTPSSRSCFADRAALPESGQICYADAEQLAFGTLLSKAIRSSVRSGLPPRHLQPAPRGGPRCNTGEPYTPLNTIREVGEPSTDKPVGRSGADGRPARHASSVYDSPLSEVSVLGFEYGYSLADPGDARLLGGPVRRLRQRRPGHHRPVPRQRRNQVGALVRPGDAAAARLRGRGPRALFGRLERFLQLCGENNMQVVYAQYWRPRSSTCSAVR